jgi:hypothetical protein
LTNALAYQIAELTWRISDRRHMEQRYPAFERRYMEELDGLYYALGSARSALQWLGATDRRAVCAKAREFSAGMRLRHDLMVAFAARHVRTSPRGTDGAVPSINHQPSSSN